APRRGPAHRHGRGRRRPGRPRSSPYQRPHRGGGHPMNPDDLVAAARSETGLDDFGSDSYREGLEVYCRSLAEEAQLNELGGMAIAGNVVGALSARLRLVDWAK